ncbi:unnamed protein product [Thlaspi arvense]|uniref:Transmembrane protein n=1 Tax=Thlaspi arvense TaxID=13288 RepID=A0AAU9RAW8_THLAR|nr:unnamed protein product [Thlaspi arvense]
MGSPQIHQKLRLTMESISLALFIILLFFLCFPFSSDSQKLNPSTSLLGQEQVHEVTSKNIKGEDEDKSIDIFRSGKGVHGVAGGRGGGGRKASPKRNATTDHRPQLFFSAASVLFTGFMMFSLTSFHMSIRLT